MGAVTLRGPGVMVEVGLAVAVGVQVCPRESAQTVFTGVGVLEGLVGLLPLQEMTSKAIPKTKGTEIIKSFFMALPPYRINLQVILVTDNIYIFTSRTFSGTPFILNRA